MKLKHKIILVTRLALVSSFLFAGGVNNTKIPPTAIVQHICATHSGDGGAVTSAGTCDHFGSELVFYNDETNSIPSLNISTDYQPSNNINTDYPDPPQSVTMSRDGETIYQFTNCEQTGRSGPSQSQATSAYSGTNLDGEVFIFDQGIQEWTIPTTGEYIIDAYGAQGGNLDGDGGKGARMRGEFSLNQGDVIFILVGQQGTDSYEYAAGVANDGGGGGGGTFVVKKSGSAVAQAQLSDILVIAGGGGGITGNNYNSVCEGRTSTDGGDTRGNGGGTNGSGGENGQTNGEAAGGGGFLTNGEDSGNGTGTTGGKSFLNGGEGGTATGSSVDGGNGDFGGGGGGWHNSLCRSGGGGGYSGGQGGTWSGVKGGGGGGSINNGSNPSPTAGTREGHGLVVITSAAPSNTAPTATAQSVTGNEDSPQTITLAGSDAEGDALTYALATTTSNETSTLSGNVLTYTPNANYNGSDNFTFTASDGELTSSSATVNISITAVNDIPVITSTPALDALDGSLYDYSVSVNDVDGDDVTMTAPTKPVWLTISNNNSNSLSFDGNNDYVSMPSMVAPSGNAPRTFMAWIKRDDTSTAWPGRAIGGWGNDAGNELMNIMILNDVLYWHVYGGNSLTGSTQINPDTWYHITATYDGTTQRFYVDGILDGSNNWNVNTGSGNVKFGRQPDYNGAYFDGLIDGGAIWSDALTAEEITAIYNSGNPLDSPNNLMGYWNLNEGSGTTVNDLSSNGNDGTINGASWSTDVPSSSYVLSGIPGSSDGGLHDIILSANDGNGGIVTQSYTVAVSLHSLEISESGFRILSSPVSGTIYSDLLEELWTQGAEGSDNANSNPNIWTYGNGWNPVTDFSSDALTAGQGFLMYVFADTDFDGDDDLNDPENPVTISIDGTQQQSATSVVSEPSDWNLIGNPYGLSVDISQMLSDNNTRFNSTVYSLDRTNPGYRTHNGTVGNIQDDEIKPFDGFWIQADTDGDVFEFTEQSIRRGSINSNGRTTTDESSGSAVFTFTNGGYSSSTYLSFTPEGQINLDPADANRLVPLSPAEHLTSMIYESSKSLAINNLPFDLSTDISMDMDVMMLSPTDDGYATQAEQVDLTWDITNLPEGITLVLRNNITGQNINLTGYPSAIISLPSKGSFLTSGDFMATYPAVGQSQFTLSVYGTLVAAEDDDILPERITMHSAYPNPFNPSTIISFDLPDADMVSLDIFDIAGRQVASLISEYMIPGSHQINWNPGNLSSGIYLVNLVIGTKTFNQKITFIK